MKIFFLFSFLLCFITQSILPFDFLGEIKAYKKLDDRIEFELSNARFNLYVVSEEIIRFRYTNQSNFSDAPSYGIVYKNESPIDFSFTEKERIFELRTSKLIVQISKSPCRIGIYDLNMNLINEDDPAFGVGFDNDEVRCFKRLLPNEKFFGLGEKTGGFDKRGNQYTMWNTDFPAYEWRTDPLYVSIPFFIGVRDKKAYGIYFDNTYKSYFNMGASSNRFYWFGAENGELDYYFIAGPEINKVISSYTLLTGRMELPPKWALGYQQSKWSYYPESNVLSIAEKFREKEIPADVIYLDIHYMDGYRVFTWDKERFPNPVRILRELKSKGFKVIPIIDPGVKADENYFAAQEGLNKNLFVKYPDGEVYQGEVWPSWAFFPDFTKRETRAWWGEKLSSLLKDGIEGFWNDMNEPAVWGQAFPDIVQFDDNGFGADHKKTHNVYALQMAKATSEGLKKHSPNKRHFVLTRAGFSGIQRYSAVWTGDNVANEDHLKLACIMPLGMGISGLPFVGSDVGGFIGTPSQNLYTRWLQLGAFTPFFRGHSAINEKDKEPWAFGENVENWVREIIELRYKLLPYIYNEFYNSSITGLPIMRPMFLDFQNDDQCYSWDAQFQFMLGKELLAAPVLNEHDVFKKLYLPEGKWIDYWNKKVYEGGQWIIVDAPIYRIPLFIKAGGIIPMQPVQQYVGEKEFTELELIVFPGSKNAFSLYEDDGLSFEYQNGKYSLTDFSIIPETRGLKFNILSKYDSYQTNRKSYFIRMWNVEKVASVSLNGIKINKINSHQDLQKSEQGFYFSPNEKILELKIINDKEIELTVSFQ